MKVTITPSAEASLLESYLYIYERNPVSAGQIIDDIMAYILDYLALFPKLGHIYNEAKSVYRLVHRPSGYNIYYVIRDEVVFILYILDGSMGLNQELYDPDVELPELR